MFDGPVKPAYLAFVAGVDEAFVSSGLRYGQVYFNRLCEVVPEAAERLRGTSSDPFYSDEVSDITHELVELFF